VIHFLVNAHHRYTFDDVKRALPQVTVHNYHQILRGGRLPQGTYVFCDIDRLTADQQRNAQLLYSALRSDAFACKVLNDPSRVKLRYDLLRTLSDLGHNSFTAHRATARPKPSRFPVFIRNERGHGAPLTGLIPHQPGLLAKLQELLKQGQREDDLLVIEYCAEPVAPNLFRRLAAYRVGDRIVPANTVHDDQWCVKYGKTGGGTDELYADELDLIQNNRYEAVLRPIFEAANIEYGRVDFGLVGGKVQVYEINTNPKISAPSEHPAPTRMRSQELAWNGLVTAIAALDDGPENVPQ
jgi:hypothetical protein